MLDQNTLKKHSTVITGGHFFVLYSVIYSTPTQLRPQILLLYILHCAFKLSSCFVLICDVVPHVTDRESNGFVTFHLPAHSHPPINRKKNNRTPPVFAAHDSGAQCLTQSALASECRCLMTQLCCVHGSSSSLLQFVWFQRRNMQKRRKPEPIQLNPIPDGNAINGTGATE